MAEGWLQAGLSELLSDDSPGFWGDAPTGDGDVQVLRATNLRKEGIKLDLEKLALRTFSPHKLEQKQLRSGDLLLERSGGGPGQPVGRVALFEETGLYTYSNFMQRLRADPRRCIPRFLAYRLSHLHATGETERLQQATTGIRNLHYKDYLSLRLAIPPLPEQHKIAAILSAVDEVIEKTEAVIESLQTLKEAMMQELLTRGLPGRHTRFKQTETGEIPETWEFAQVRDVCEKMFVGIAQAATHAYVPTGGVPIIRTTNVKANWIDTSGVLRLSDEFARQMASKRLRAGDVLSARTGYPGTSALVPSELDGAQCFTLLVSRPGPRLRARFLVHVMNSALGENIVKRGQAGGAQQNLNVTVFEAAKIPVPPTAEQDEIVACIEALYGRERAEVAVLDDLGATKAAIMAVLLSGELRVTPDEGAA